MVPIAEIGLPHRVAARQLARILIALLERLGEHLGDDVIEHLRHAGVKAGEITERDGRRTLDFEEIRATLDEAELLGSLQLAFREASSIPDAPGKGPGEKFTGPVS